ncbi:MAG: sensor histidine kinase, partial [Actinomycetota bacterium]
PAPTAPGRGSMPDAPARWPWLAVVLFSLVAIAGMMIVVANGEPVLAQVAYLLAFWMFSVVGALIVTRDRRNVIGLLLLWCAQITGLAFFSGEWLTWQLIEGRRGSLTVFLGFLNNFGWLVGILPVVFLLPLLFPDGRLPSRRWRAYIWFVAVLLASLAVSLVFGQKMLTGSGDIGVANPFYVQAIGELPSLDPVIALLFPALFGVTLYSLFRRFRRSRGVERQQIKWASFGFLAALVLILVSIPISDPVLNGLIGGTAFLAFPVSIGIAVLRFHLYDLDLVVKKTVVYAALGVFATFVYLGLVVGLGTWLGRGSSFLTLVAAVIVAVTFQPVRVRLSRFANRIVYGSRATPYEILADFSERVGDAYAEVDVLPRMARVLGEGIGAERSDVWLAVGAELRQVAVWPDGHVGADPVPMLNGGAPEIPGMDRVSLVEQGGDVLGALTVRKPPSDPISPADEKLIAGLASQAGLVLRNVRLTEELKLRLDDLRAAQKRLVYAQDAERRKLERNIHDGAQQQLVALAVKARLARALTDRDPVKAGEMLMQMEAETQTALEDLRDLARGIYPPLLADKGLEAALTAQARKLPMPVAVDAGDLGRFPQEVEAAVYFSTLEALQNVAKYAEASQVAVVLQESGGVLVFSVVDDGRGFDPGSVGYGTGLQGIADRLGALDGSLEVISANGSGTTITGVLPIGIGRGSSRADEGRKVTP